MSLWGKSSDREIGSAFTYAKPISGGYPTFTGPATISVKAKDIVVTENGDAFVVVSVSDVLDDDEVTGIEISVEHFDEEETFDLEDGILSVKNYPKWITDREYALRIDLVRVAEIDEEFKALTGIKTPGWVYSQTYTDANNKDRKKNETLVVMKS